MKITKNQLRRIIRENMVMRNMIQKSVQDSMGSRDEPSASPRERRRRSDPITKADIVKGSFKGTTAERAKLTDKLRKKIEKLIKDGYEKDIPSNWEEVLTVNDGDALFALSKVVFPGFFGTMMRTLFPANEGKMTEAKLRRIIREAVINEAPYVSMKDRIPTEYEASIQQHEILYGVKKTVDFVTQELESLSDLSPALEKDRSVLVPYFKSGKLYGPKGVRDMLVNLEPEMREKLGPWKPNEAEIAALAKKQDEWFDEDVGHTNAYDAGIELMAKLHGPEETLDSILDTISYQLDQRGLSPVALRSRIEVKNGIQSGEFSGPDGVRDMLKKLSPEIKDRLGVWKPRKPKPKSDTKPVSKAAPHPYDASINDAVDSGMFSNSDAVDEVQDHLRSAGATDLVDEIDDMVQYGDDDIYDILAMIPKAIKDKLPIG